MNNKYFDKETYACLDCRHRWILASDKPITDEQHNKWIREAVRQHNEIEKEEK